uniref:Uncharacterized protein n=1 Tax=Lepeophtheirus salmonis TaxID=72036 RepID=A0A0K2VBY0_LEPSM
MSKRFPVVRFSKLAVAIKQCGGAVVIKENDLVLPCFIFYTFLAYCLVQIGQFLLLAITIDGFALNVNLASTNFFRGRPRSSYLTSKSPFWNFSNQLKHYTLLRASPL